MNKLLLQFVGLLLVCMPGQNQLALAQVKPAGAATSPLCSQNNALEMIRQQAELSKSLNNTQRIAALVRAADLLWPYQQDKARAVFAEAFEVAIETEKESVDTGRRSQSVIRRMQVADQRHVVVRAIAKRDSAWAKKLIQEIVKLDTEAAELSQNGDSFNQNLTGNRLIHSANQLLTTDMNTALELARTSLNYPASFMLTYFLYQLAKTNQPAADQFYSQALATYSNKPLREFLYLQAYPFAARETVTTPVFAFHENVPAGFVPNRSLQRQLVQNLLRRAQQALEAPSEQNDSYQDPGGTWIPATAHLLRGLIRLEPQLRESLPDLLPALHDAREKLLVSLSVENQKLFIEPGREATVAPYRTFAERIESAQKEPDIYERDQIIATAVMGAGSESLEDVTQALEKISDSDLRADLIEWLHFQRATSALKEKQFDETERMTARVEGHEERAFLYVELAKALLNKSDMQIHAREVLDDAIVEARKAGTSIFAARVLLTASTLYAKIDLSRSVSVLADAINCINRIDAPDFVSDDQTIEKSPRRKGKGGRYEGEYSLWFYMPGLEPESVFRELGKIDFDTSLSQSSGLKDKFQRGLSVMALADVCLQQTKQRPKTSKGIL